MAEAMIAQGYTTREERALRLWRERGSEITEYAPNMWAVPAASGDRTYHVAYGGDEAEEEYCSCPDFQYRGNVCKHLMAVAIKNAKVRPTRQHHGCYGGVVYLTYEEDGYEWEEPVPCKVCNG